MRDLLNLFLESKIPCKPTHLSHVLASLLLTSKRFGSRTSLYKTQIVSSPMYVIYVCICSNQYLYLKWICQLHHASWAVPEVLAPGEFPRGGLPSTSEGQQRDHGEQQAPGSPPPLQLLQPWAENQVPGKPFPTRYLNCAKHCYSTLVFPLLILITKRQEVWRGEPRCGQIHILIFFTSWWRRCRGYFEMMLKGEWIVFLVWKTNHSSFKYRKLNLFSGTMWVLFPSSSFPPACHWQNIMVCFQTAVP